MRFAKQSPRARRGKVLGTTLFVVSLLYLLGLFFFGDSLMPQSNSADSALVYNDIGKPKLRYDEIGTSDSTGDDEPGDVPVNEPAADPPEATPPTAVVADAAVEPIDDSEPLVLPDSIADLDPAEPIADVGESPTQDSAFDPIETDDAAPDETDSLVPAEGGLSDLMGPADDDAAPVDETDSLVPTESGLADLLGPANDDAATLDETESQVPAESGLADLLGPADDGDLTESVDDAVEPDTSLLPVDPVESTADTSDAPLDTASTVVSDTKPAAPTARIWTRQNGKKAKAVYVKAERKESDWVVSIASPADASRVFEVPLSMLSEEDVQYVNEQLQKARP